MTTEQTVLTQKEINDKLAEWYKVSAQLSTAKAREMELRKELFGVYFPSPTEGTNTVGLVGEWVIKGKHVINRTIDEAIFTAKKAELLEKNISIDALVRWKPELNTRPYKALKDEDRILFDQVLDIKVGAPSLEVVKKAK